MVCYFKHDPTSERLKLCGAATRLLPAKTWILFFSKYIVSPSETQRHLSGVSAYSHSCGSKVKSRSVCVEVTQEASGIFSALGSLGATFNHKDEGIQHVSPPFQHIDVFRPIVIFLQIRSCFVKVSECYDLKYVSPIYRKLGFQYDKSGILCFKHLRH